MNTEAIVIYLRPEVAAAYRDAPREDRHKMDLLVSLCLRELLASRQFLRDTGESTETIVVNVDPKLAAAYRTVPGERRRKFGPLLSQQFAELLKPTIPLEGAIEQMSREAAAVGLTPEVADSIVRSEQPDLNEPLPVSLKVVAGLFILSGASCLIEIVVALLNKQIDFNFGVLGLFIGSGLLRLSRGWRTCALVFVWIELILLPIIGLIGMVMRPPPDVKLFSQTMASAPAEIGAVVVLVAFFVAVWQYWALTRPDVRRLFGLTPDEE